MHSVSSSTLSRREFLGAVGAAGVALSGAPLAHAAARKKIPVGLQLYSVREQCKADLPGTLAAVAKIGYPGVEFAGYHGRRAKELRQLLDDNGLKVCGTHTPYDSVLGDKLKETIEFNRTIGNRFLIVSYMGEDRMGTVEKIGETAKLFTEIAAKVKPDGMRVGYHAHGGDFKKVDGETAWDRFFTAAGSDVTMQMDLGNCLGGGGDPYATLKKFPGRSATIHLKEHGGKPGAPVGEGDVKWDEVFRLCETTGRTEWYIVEQESYAGAPLDSVKQCIDNLRKRGK